MNELVQSETRGPMMPAGSTPSDLLSVAVANGASMETLERLMALKERYDANEARKAFVEAMAQFKAEPMVIEKRKIVSFETNDGKIIEYAHAELSDVTSVVVPAMARAGLSHRWTVKQEAGNITVECIVTHAMGHSESVSMTAAPDNSGKKNAIQQVASTVSYLQRYTLLATTGMATTGVDDDGRGANDADVVDPNQAWIDAIRSCTTKTELKARKRECVEAFGTAEKVPSLLQAEFATKAKVLESGAQA